MYTVLIADDEPIHRRGVMSLIRRIRPSYCLFEARDGEEALRIIHSNDIDFIITDIKMPNVDGLQLIERLGSRLKTMKVIILSAYGYFEYAKKAIALGAFEYVLKPIEESDIEATLSKLEESIEKDHKLIQEKNNMEQRLNHTMPVYLEHLLNKWVEGGVTQAELHEIEKIIPVKSSSVIVVSEIDSTSGFNFASADGDGMALAVKYRFEEAFKLLGNSVCFFHGGKRNILVSIVNSEGDSCLGSDQLADCANKFINQLKTQYGYDATVGIGKTSNSIYKEVKMCYDQALTAFAYTFYYDAGSVALYDQIPFDQHKIPFSKFVQEDALSDAIVRLNRDSAKRIIDDMFDRIIAAGFQPPQRVTENIVYFVLNQIKRSENMLSKEQYDSLADQADSALANCKYYEDLRNRVKEIALFVITNMENRKNNRNSAIIQKCKDFIEENYKEDISLDAMAKKFYFSPAYFSSFFKNYTGVSFLEFILQTRLNKARLLLIQTEDKVHDVALKVGYKDQGYFAKIFKREIGVTPEEFRRINGMTSGL